MLTGNVMFYALTDGRSLPDYDRDASAEYAQRVSRDRPDALVEWTCTNGDHGDVRYFVAGRAITEAVAHRILRGEDDDA